ncbi:hypothetical protein [Nonomuraea sp. B1E8]|uniref:DUF6941 family protein n=1 Tax=unclassified Nonomuraea TaxID=2593643 RepID=UPI00325D81C9
MIEAFLVLADSATTDRASGKVHMLGAGWSLTGPAIPPSAITGFLRIPWNEAGDEVRFRLQLLDDAHQAVTLLHDEADTRPVRYEGTVALRNAQPADEVMWQVPMNLSFAISIPPLPLASGRTYEWMLEVEDVEVASVRFAVRPEGEQPA